MEKKILNPDMENGCEECWNLVYCVLGEECVRDDGMVYVTAEQMEKLKKISRSM